MENPNDIQSPASIEAFRKEVPTVSVDSAKSLGENAKNFDQTRTVAKHFHNDIDSDKISYNDLEDVPAASVPNFYVHWSLENNLPQTANNFYGSIFIAPVACQVVSIRETHKDAATGALTLHVYKNSTDLLSSNFDLNGVGGDVITVGSLTGTLASLQFAVGDRLAWGVSGSVAGIRGVCITVEFQPL